MNNYLTIMSYISSLLYPICGALYIFIALRFRTYIELPQHKHLSFVALIVVPIAVQMKSPIHDLITILALLQLALTLALLSGSLIVPHQDQVTDVVFGLLSTALMAFVLFGDATHAIYQFPLHFWGMAASGATLLTLLLASLNNKNTLPKSTLGFILIAALLSAFIIPRGVQFAVHIIYACGFLDWVRLQSNAFETTILEIQTKNQKIEKDFNDAVRKEVNKHMFYHELSKDKIKTISQTDDLTQSLNKKALLNLTEEMIGQKKPFAMLMFDIDKFKTINDTLGHIVGDMCLKNLATIARRCIRDNDILSRYGGDEFIILLPQSDLQNATRIAERFRMMIAQTEDPHFTVSIGISCFPEDGKDVKTLIQCADEGLYISKRKGRNQVSHKRDHRE